MSSSTLSSGIALLFVFVLSYLCGLLFKIKADKFYRPFHFAGGFLAFMFTHSLVSNKILCLFSVILIGIGWEIYEWGFWKFLVKRRSEKPEKKDTINDLVMDLSGGFLAFLLTSLV